MRLLMKKIIEKSKENLANLSALSARTITAEKNILKSSILRLAAVQQDIDSMTGVDGGGDTKETKYLALIHERGQLNIVIDKARTFLGI